MLEFYQLAHQCAPGVNEITMARIVRTESGYNPYAVGVVGARLKHQPKTKAEAVATAGWLEKKGFNYSVGLAQINRANFPTYSLTPESAFDPCRNLQAAAQILSECYERALRVHPERQTALRDSFSCYYSGNFSTGYKSGYVASVLTGKSRVHNSVSVEPAGEAPMDKGQPPSALLF